jgi:serine/threonine-protein kinase HipA
LLGSDGQVRLAPIYDLASVFPYPDFDAHRMRLAMKLGGEYKLWNIGVRQWQKLAKEVRLDEQGVLSRVREMAQAIPEQIAQVANRMKREGLKHPILEKLEKKLSARVAHCRKLLVG